MGFPGLIWLYDLFLNLKASLLASLLLLSPSIAHSPLSSQSDFSYQVYQRSISALLLKILQELPSAIRRTSHSLPSSLAHSLSTLIPHPLPCFLQAPVTQTFSLSMKRSLLFTCTCCSFYLENNLQPRSLHGHLPHQPGLAKMSPPQRCLSWWPKLKQSHPPLGGRFQFYLIDSTYYYLKFFFKKSFVYFSQWKCKFHDRRNFILITNESPDPRTVFDT